MFGHVVAHAAGQSTAGHAVVDTAVGVGVGLLLVGAFYLWLRVGASRDGDSRSRSE